MANEGLQGFPTKNVIILVVTVTGWGVDLRYALVMSVSSIFSKLQMETLETLSEFHFFGLPLQTHMEHLRKELFQNHDGRTKPQAAEPGIFGKV